MGCRAPAWEVLPTGRGKELGLRGLEQVRGQEWGQEGGRWGTLARPVVFEKSLAGPGQGQLGSLPHPSGDAQKRGESVSGAMLDRGVATDRSIPQVEGAARRSTSMVT